MPRTTSPQHAGRDAAALLGGIALFQAGLAAGAPWGAAAWGGRHRGTLPTNLRLASAGSAVALVALARDASRAGDGGPARRRRLRMAAGYMAVGVVVNAASPSIVERLWSPVNAAAALLLLRASSADAAS